MPKVFIYGRLVDHSSRLPGRSETPETTPVHDTNQVFQALAEGFRLVLAET